MINHSNYSSERLLAMPPSRFRLKREGLTSLRNCSTNLIKKSRPFPGLSPILPTHSTSLRETKITA